MIVKAELEGFVLLVDDPCKDLLVGKVEVVQPLRPSSIDELLKAVEKDVMEVTLSADSKVEISEALFVSTEVIVGRIEALLRLCEI